MTPNLDRVLPRSDEIGMMDHPVRQPEKAAFDACEMAQIRGFHSESSSSS